GFSITSAGLFAGEPAPTGLSLAPVGAGSPAKGPALATQILDKKTGTRRFPFFHCLTSESAWKRWRVHTSHLFHHANHLAAVTKFVVVPDVQDNAVVVADGGFGIDHTGVARTNEVGRNHFLRADVVDLLVQFRVHGG